MLPPVAYTKKCSLEIPERKVSRAITTTTKNVIEKKHSHRIYINKIGRGESTKGVDDVESFLLRTPHFAYI